MNVRNTGEGIVRVDIDGTEFLFAADETQSVTAAIATRLITAHPSLSLDETEAP